MTKGLLTSVFVLSVTTVSPALADTALEQWRSRLGEVRRLMENDPLRANAEALTLQYAVPNDAAPVDRAQMLNILSRIDLYLGQTEQASQHIREAEELAERHGDKTGLAEAELNSALNNINLARIDDMNQAVMRAMRLLEGTDRPDLLGEAMLRTSMMYRRMEQLDDSVAIAVQALDIANRKGNPIALAYAYQGMAIAYDINHRHEEAADYYRLMREQAIAVRSKRLEAEALLGLGASTHGDHPGNEAMTRKAIEMFRDMHMPFYLAHAQVNLAENLRLQNRATEAVSLLDEVVSLYDKGNNKIGLWWGYYIRSNDYLVSGKNDAAAADAERGYRLAQEIGFPLYLGKSAKLIGAIAAAKGDYKLAYRSTAEADEMSAKAAAQKASTRMVELAAHYQNEIKQRQIDTLNHRNELQGAEIVHRTLLQRWLWTVLGFTLILLSGSLAFWVRQRRANRLLEAANIQLQRWYAIFEHSEWGVVVCSADGNVLELMNPAFAAMHGYSVAELTGKPVADVFAPQSRNGFAEQIASAHRQGHHAFESWHLRKDGTIFPVFIDITTVLKPSGDVLHRIVNVQDITGRKRMEEQLIASEQRYRTVFENSPVSIWEEDFSAVDAAFDKLRQEGIQDIEAHFDRNPSLIRRYAESVKIVDVNRAALTLHEAENKEALFSGLVSTFTPESFETFREELVCLWQGGTSMVRDSVVKTLAGFRRDVVVHLSVCPGYEQSFAKVLVSLSDISERKRAEIALAMREREFRTLAQSLPDNIARYDRLGRTIYVNPTLVNTLGVEASQLLGSTIRGRYPNGEFDDYAEMVERALAYGEDSELEKFLPAKLNQPAVVHQIRVIAERDENGAVVGALAIGRDITGQKAAERELRESERRYREVFENVSDSLYLLEVRPDGRFVNLAFNFAFELTTGLAREELIGRASTEKNLSEQFIGMDISKYRYCVEAGMPVEEEVVLDLPSGRRILYSTLIPLRDANGLIYRILGVARDVTEIIRAERNFRTLAENAPDNICRFDRECRVIYLNPHLEKTLDIAAVDLWDKTLTETFPDGRFAAYQAKIGRVLASGLPDEIEIKAPGNDGRLRYHQFRFVAEREAGEIVGVLAIGHDITELKRAADQIQALNLTLEQRVQERTEELRQQTRYLRTIIDSLPLRVWLKNTESRYVLVNQSVAASCRLSVDEMVGKSDADLWPPALAATYVAEDREVMATRQRRIVEEAMPHTNGLIWIEIDKVPVLDDDGSVLGTVGVARNISERKAMEVARERALAEAVRLAGLRAEFMARMSHELRTPLNGILGYAQLLAGEDSLDQRLRGMLDVIRQSGEHLLALINDILDFAKIEAGKQTLNPKDVGLLDFLHGLASIVKVRAEQKGLYFVCDFAVDLPRRVRVDEIRLRQVLLNLLANAVKYSERGQIRFAVSAPEDRRLHFEVQDNGIGIEAEQLERIFQPFEQADGSRHNAGGTGLGLAISRELVRLMGSDILVSSRVGEGSSFGFDLKVETIPPSAVISGDDDRVDADLATRQRVAVLGAAAETAEMLEGLGFETYQAACAEECLEIFSRNKPDLILLDASEAELDGDETIGRLRASWDISQMPIVAITGASGFRYKGGEGRIDILTKPVDPRAVAAYIGGVLNVRRQVLYQEAILADSGVADNEWAVPAVEELTILHRLAMEGNMRDIILRASQLAALDERFRPFAERLSSLAHGYQSKAVLALVEAYFNRYR